MALYRHTDIDLKVEVDRKKVIKKLKENLKKHQAENKSATELYTISLIKFCQENLTRAQSNKSIKRSEPPKPKDYSDEYKRAIEMLELSNADTITLTANDYAKFYLDEWEWTRDWFAINSTYGAGGMFDDED